MVTTLLVQDFLNMFTSRHRTVQQPCWTHTEVSGLRTHGPTRLLARTPKPNPRCHGEYVDFFTKCCTSLTTTLLQFNISSKLRIGTLYQFYREMQFIPSADRPGELHRNVCIKKGNTFNREGTHQFLAL